MKTNTIMCFAWFNEQEFLQLRLHADDLIDLHDNYADWLENANQVMKLMKKQGISVKKSTCECGAMGSMVRRTQFTQRWQSAFAVCCCIRTKQLIY